MATVTIYYRDDDSEFKEILDRLKEDTRYQNFSQKIRSIIVRSHQSNNETSVTSVVEDGFAGVNAKLDKLQHHLSQLQLNPINSTISSNDGDEQKPPEKKKKLVDFTFDMTKN